MARACFTLVASAAVLAVAAASAAHAGPVSAPFGCNVGRGHTASCFFKLFLGPRYTRVVELQPGMTVNIPGINIGTDRYCSSAATPPLPTCAPTPIKVTINN